jgi:predicted MFS family arabinose efflux permease
VPSQAKQNESLLKTTAGYGVALRDLPYMSFTLAGMLVLIVYQQQYSSLPVYLLNIHNIDSRSYGTMLAISGLEVVLFQIWISRVIRKLPPFLMMMLGALFFMAGFIMIGFVRGFPLSCREYCDNTK